MRSFCLVSVVMMGALAMGAAGIAAGQEYPRKSVRIVTSEPGGGNDFGARLLAQGISPGLGQPVIVDNRGGAGGIIAIDTVAKAPRDGYTLLFYGTTVWVLPLLQKTPYDPVRDFSPVTLVDSAPYIVVVNPGLAAKSIKDLIALARARPGELSYASGGTGSATHLAGALFVAMTGVDIVHVPYKANGPAYADLMGGRVELMFTTAGGAAPHVKSGKLRAIAVGSAEPSSMFPGVPTVASAGLTGYEAVTSHGLFAPAGSPVEVIRRLNQEAVRFLRTPDAKERFLRNGVEAVGSSPEQLAAIVRAEMARLGKVIKEIGVRVE